MDNELKKHIENIDHAIKYYSVEQASDSWEAIKAWNTRKEAGAKELRNLIDVTTNALDWGHGPHIRDFIDDLNKLLPKAPTTK